MGLRTAPPDCACSPTSLNNGLVNTELEARFVQEHDRLISLIVVPANHHN